MDKEDMSNAMKKLETIEKYVNQFGSLSEELARKAEGACPTREELNGLDNEGVNEIISRTEKVEGIVAEVAPEAGGSIGAPPPNGTQPGRKAACVK